MKDVLRLMASPIALAWWIYRIMRLIFWSTIEATVGCWEGRNTIEEGNHPNA